MKKNLLALFALSALAAISFLMTGTLEAALFSRSPKQRNPRASVPDQIIVRYKQHRTTEAMRNSIAARHNMRTKKYIPFAGVHVYKLQSPKDKRMILNTLNQNPAVVYAEPDYLISIDTVPIDTQFNQLWGLHNTGQSGGTPDADIDAPEAWTICTGSPDVVVALIDTGVDYNHRDLAANMWQNPGETPGDGIDNDGNGYVDDVYGINTLTPSGNPMDNNNHGTHCAGIIGAVGNNSIGVAGVSWNVKIMALKSLDADGDGTTSGVIECMQYAVDKGAGIISCSWSTWSSSSALSNAVQTARQQGVLIIAATGNSTWNTDYYPRYPASYTSDNIIAAAATDHDDSLAAFSGYGATSVDVAAPGVDIYSTLPGNTYGSLSGTSMAAAHVAGLAALLKAHDPALTYLQIKNRILDSAEFQPSLLGKVLTESRINALYALQSNFRPTISITSHSDNDFVSGTVSIQVNAADPDGIDKVEFYVDDILAYTDTAAPHQFSWDTTSQAHSFHNVKAVAYDAMSRLSNDRVTVFVNNTGLPGVYITSPREGRNMTGGSYTFAAIASYTPGIDKVEFLMNGTPVGEATSEPYQVTFDSGSLPRGEYTLTAKAYGSDASTGTHAIIVHIDNVPIPESERNALIALYNSTQGDSWYSNDDWKKPGGSFNDPGTEYRWWCVEVEDNHVVNLYLDGNNLNGTLPPEIGNLTHLKELTLFWNDLSGPIPPEIGNMTALQHLDFDDCNLTGPLPTELGNLVNLQAIWLNDNNFNCAIPASFGNLTSLRFAGLWRCGFTGTIPPEIGNMSSLEELDLSENNLTGSIPTEIGNLTQLQELCLSHNRLSGSIPSSIGNLTSLENLYLTSNMLTGEIPGTVTNLAALVIADISYNGLYTSDDAVRSFIDNCSPDWSLTQTPAPVDVNAAVNSSSSATLNWTPISFVSYPGKYNIYISQTPGGPYTLKGSTADKNAASFTMNDLLPQTAYYFVAQSQTDPHDYNANTVLSDYGTEIPVTTPAVQNITITAPDGGESWNGCSTYPVTWTSEGPVGNVSIEYSTTGADGTYIPVAASVPNSGSYDWTVPDTDASQCFIRIRDVDNTPTDTSGAAFTISPCPGLTLTAPNGGESVNRGTTASITWNYINITGSVTIELYKAGSAVQVLGTPDVSTGTFAWNIPADLATGGDYKIKISRVALEDDSDAVFTIAGAQNFADFNKDGKPDLLWRNYGTNDGRNVVWFMDNDQRAGFQYINRVYNLDWKIVGTGDFNNDGNTDILWRNIAEGGGQNLVWFMNGTTKTSHAYLPRVYNLNWKVSGTGDFNGDGKVDILWRYDVSGQGQNLIWYMDGISKTSHQYINPVANTNWRVASVNDFNSDGKPDILWRYYGTGGKNVVWFMDGPVKTSHAWLNSTSNLDWKIEGTGDFNRDGHTDILWRNYGTKRGDNVIWYMNGTTKTGHSYLNRVYNLNWNIENH